MQFSEKKRRKIFINITSLIDVLFLLLIFLIISTTFVEQPGMKLELPEAKSFSTEKISQLILEIDVGGDLKLNEQPVSLENLGQQFKKIIPELAEKSLILKADKNVPHGTVVKVMDIAKQAGLEKLIIATRLAAANNEP